MTFSDEVERKIAEAERQELIRKLGLIDRAELARRLRGRGPLQLLKHEREFLADLADGKKAPRHRPQSVDTALGNDWIVKMYLWLEASAPKLQKGQVAHHVGNLFGVSPDYVRRLVRTLSPRRRKQIDNEVATLLGLK